MLELSAQEEVEALMKVVERQQGDILRLLMNQTGLYKENTDRSDQVVTQFSTLVESTAANQALIAQIISLKEDEFKFRSKINSSQQEQTRLTSTVSRVRSTTVLQCHDADVIVATYVVSNNSLTVVACAHLGAENHLGYLFGQRNRHSDSRPDAGRDS
jgi:hypothetical protein